MVILSPLDQIKCKCTFVPVCCLPARPVALVCMLVRSLPRNTWYSPAIIFSCLFVICGKNLRVLSEKGNVFAVHVTRRPVTTSTVLQYIIIPRQTWKPAPYRPSAWSCLGLFHITAARDWSVSLDSAGEMSLGKLPLKRGHLHCFHLSTPPPHGRKWEADTMKSTWMFQNAVASPPPPPV